MERMQFRHRGSLSVAGLMVLSMSSLGLPASQAKTYKVQSGDSLWTIARKFDTHVTTVCELNHLTEKSALKLGQALQIPADTPQSAVAIPSHPSDKAASPIKVELEFAKGRAAYVNKSQAIIRSAPSTSSKPATMVSLGTPCKILGVASTAGAKWHRVLFGNGKQGWVREDLIKAGSPPPAIVKLASLPVKQARGVAFIKGNSVNVRHLPGTEAPRLAKAAKGTRVKLLAKSNGWYKVKFPNGKQGWVIASLLLDRSASKMTAMYLGSGPRAYALKDGINLRGGPGREHPRVGKVIQGTPMRICARRGDWYKVRCANGTTGWIAGFLVKEVRQVERSVRSFKGYHRSYRTYRTRRSGHSRFRFSPTNIPGLPSFAKMAMGYRGAPYVRGSSYPSRGFDCSGLVYHVMQKNGVSVPRTARAQYGSVGTPVSKGNLQPGDLVFFKNTYRRGVSHVGIYVGGGKFVHAANRRKGVTVTNLNTSFYNKKYAGARRVK